MTDEVERPEDTVRRFAGQIEQLLGWQAKYREAAELWDELKLKPNQQVVGACVVAKVKDFENNNTSVCMSVTDHVDWVDQIGILRAGTLICERAEIEAEDD